MQNLSDGAVVSNRMWPRSENPLIRLDRWLGSLSIGAAVSALTTGAAALAVLFASSIWLIAFGTVPYAIPALAGIVAGFVAWPIILHSQRLIKALDRRKRDLINLTVALAESRDAAEASNRAKVAFLANMSHELRTPLNAIIGFSEMIKDGKNGPATPAVYADYAADIHASGRHLLDTINSVLELSRLEAGHTSFALEPIDLPDLIAGCLRELDEEAAKAGVALVNQAAHPIEISADPRAVRRILLNTLSNAIKFNRTGGTVRIDLADTPGTATMTITDSGIGMTGTEIVAALQPFQQIDTSLGRRHGGAGLGLPLAKALIEQHGGRLHIDSEPGVGTMLALTFPLASPMAAGR